MNADIIMMISILALGFGLVPQIIKNFKTRTCGVVLGTTAVTAVALWVMVGCFYSMEQWFSLFGCSTQAAMWTVMLGQWFAYRGPWGGCKMCKHRLNALWRRGSVCSITGKVHGKNFHCGRFTEEDK